MTRIQARNRRILQMRKEGVPRREVALRFGLSAGRVLQIEKRDAGETALAERRAKLRAVVRAADDPERLWAVKDMADAIGLSVVTEKRLLDHFQEVGKDQTSLRELMDMTLRSPVEGLDFMMAPLLGIHGIGRKGFWSVVNGLTNMDLGSHCNEEWCRRLAKVMQQSQITGATPYFSVHS